MLLVADSSFTPGQKRYDAYDDDAYDDSLSLQSTTRVFTNNCSMFNVVWSHSFRAKPETLDHEYFNVRVTSELLLIVPHQQNV